jgi:hypothetical protein
MTDGIAALAVLLALDDQVMLDFFPKAAASLISELVLRS